MAKSMRRRRSGIAASVVAACGLTTGAIPSPAFAGVCASTTDCTLTLNTGNGGSGFGTGNFGTVHLVLNTTTHIAAVTVDLANGCFIIDTGFPGSFGFADSLGGSTDRACRAWGFSTTRISASLAKSTS